MPILLTGVAGFIGRAVAKALLMRGESVIGIDSLNAYYDPRLKQARLDSLAHYANFRFAQLDLSDPAQIRHFALTEGLSSGASDKISIIHLAAQAGVRHSLVAPFDYAAANLVGQLTMLEWARDLPNLQHFVYASSSSVYGGNRKIPFAPEDATDRPQSLYAATKKSGEHLAYCYSHLFHFPVTGLRFFTVYGPWGRPDMAAWLFTEAILAGRPLKLFNHGAMRRDFTFIDDIVSGVVAALDRPPPPDSEGVRQKIYNLGHDQPVTLRQFVATLEQKIGRPAEIIEAAMEPGDVVATWANIDQARRDLGFDPKTTLEHGISQFVDWYRDYILRS
ncbi:MAG: GDP-mannose 4,6-dehydratase [Candidatus Symbiobacter sp.]|nr:GDP-mannose 4,6-dehydratase [Candidatus Symbiobacter sp.]